MDMTADAKVLRELAKRCMDAAANQDAEKVKSQWRRLHDCDMERPMIYIWTILFTEELEEITRLQCTHPLFREKEKELRTELYHQYLGDDSLVQPYLSLKATHVGRENGPWGPGMWAATRTPDQKDGAAHVYADPPLKSLDELDKIRTVKHCIDEEKTAADRVMLEEAVGDIMPVHVARTPVYYQELVASSLMTLRGMTPLMMDMLERPEKVHRILKIMQKAAIAAHEKAERLGDISRADQFIQSCTYSHYTVDPEPNVPARCNELWCYMHTQDFTGVSPEMHKEFALDYQRPIMEMFGASGYGCCEDLTHKIDILREVKNLKQIAVTPAANLERCAEQIGTDYIVSWRPNPSDHVCVTFDPDRIRRQVTEAREVLAKYGCHYEINLKDVLTVQGDRERVREWVRIVRDVIE